MPAPAEVNFFSEGNIAPIGFCAEIDALKWGLSTIEWNISSSGFTVSLKAEIAAELSDQNATEEI
jgi:hypothetical protein